MVYFCGHIECPRLVLAGQLRGRLWLPPRSPVGPQHARRISFPRPSAPPRHERLSFSMPRDWQSFEDATKNKLPNRVFISLVPCWCLESLLRLKEWKSLTFFSLTKIIRV